MKNSGDTEERSANATDSFFNAKSMVTPGIAGGLTMLFANLLYSQFDLPHKWTGLGFSFLFAVIVFVQARAKSWSGLLFIPLNALIIFSVAAGTNSFGNAVQSKNEDSGGDTAAPAAPLSTILVITNKTATNLVVAPDNVKSPEEVKRWVSAAHPGFKLMNVKEAAVTEVKEESTKQQFFKPWFPPPQKRVTPKPTRRTTTPPTHDGAIDR